MCQAQVKHSIHAGIATNKSKTDHEANGQKRWNEVYQGTDKGLNESSGCHAEKERRKDRTYEDSRTG